ncbi:MAG: sodium:proton antiporter [Clostridia bacterium]|nr:sodium:proton antiporter [Clostridia bacterium]
MTEQAINAKTNSKKKIGNIIFLAIMIVIAIAFLVQNPSPEELGWFTVVPPIFVLAFILLTKEVVLGLVLAGVMASIMYFKAAFFTEYVWLLYGTVTSEDFVWVMLVCGFMGSLINLIEKAGGAFAFGDFVAAKAKSRKGVLIWTWLLGLIIFLDDYLNALTIGSSMAKVTDKHKVSREMLSYVVDSTAAPVCVIIPISTWAAFVANLLEVNGWAPEGQGMIYYFKTIPYNFYAWVAAFIVPLVIIGVVPVIGRMKKAEERARETGVLAPPGSEKIDIKGGKEVEIPKKPKIINFFLPIIVLVAATVYYEIDLYMGVVVALIFSFFFYIPQKVVSVTEFIELSINGFKNMMLMFVIIAVGYTFGGLLDQIGFIQFTIDSASGIMSPQLMPFIIFIVFGITEFMIGANWTLYIIALPIVIPLSIAIGANTPLCVAAVLSAGVWGSHICMYSDATLLTSAATGCDNYEHAVTQMPFGFIAAGISAFAFLISGFVF